MTNPSIRFIRCGQAVTLVNVPPTRTLLEVLREDLGATGTKEGCGEGDCGACTVVIGEAVDGRIEYKAINSCIRLAHSVDGLALWTVEDLTADPLIQAASADLETPPVIARPKAAAIHEPGGHGLPRFARNDSGARTAGQGKDAGPGQLHPVQQAMVQCHGSQCGFCTPGFVMSLFGLYQNQGSDDQPVTREQAQAGLSGNLCRCTGYRPILVAAQCMDQFPPVRVDEAALLLKLDQIRTPPLSAPADPSPASGYMAPQSLTELLALRSAHPQAQLVAGCTDVGLWVTKQHRDFAQVLDLTRVAELRRIARHPDHIAIGAAVTLTEAFDALVADRPRLESFAQRFAGLPVRNSGTLGGNVANGSPIGDSMPLLIALGASLVLMRQQDGQTAAREMPLEKLYTGYRQNVMALDEVLAWIKVPLAGSHPHPHPPIKPGAGSLPQAGEGVNSPTAAPGVTHLPLRGEGWGEGLAPEQADMTHAPPLGDTPSFTPSPLWGEGGGEGQASQQGREFLRVYKISKRFEDDISAVCLAVRLQIDGSRILRASIGAGGVAATPVRATQTEAFLLGKPMSQATFDEAAAVLRAEFQPISDMRASAAYRREVLGNLLHRLWLDSQGLANHSIETLELEALA